ncbi:IS66 family transposase zinc-finger binding domain-containing protein [Frigoriglobus tundricola]|uniref:IS66 family transposase zinc-finger binding domain-containing protein n=1 Tax=Frigoriglobus tundricola TaxID=2774151 RepID=UPI001D07DE85
MFRHGLRRPAADRRADPPRDGACPPGRKRRPPHAAPTPGRAVPTDHRRPACRGRGLEGEVGPGHDAPVRPAVRTHTEATEGPRRRTREAAPRPRPFATPGAPRTPRHGPRSDPDERRCSGCGGDRVCIGQTQTEQLDCDPTPYFVRRTIRKTYACQQCPRRSGPRTGSDRHAEYRRTDRQGTVWSGLVGRGSRREVPRPPAAAPPSRPDRARG